jgi:uncharacterized RDD family membrane protein YckC
MKIKKYHPQHSILPSDEIRLAGFWRRTASILIDLIVIEYIIKAVKHVCIYFGLQTGDIHMNKFHVVVTGEGVNENYVPFIEVGFTLIPILYFALFTYFTNGKTIGKFITRIRVVSIYHSHISFWHCIERALGYAASTLEAGLGFLQIFWNPNRMCLHDRIAETIVVSEKHLKEKK